MYNLERDAHGFACAISKDGQWLIHFQPGTVLTEHNIEMIVRELNAGQGQKEQAERAERALKNIRDLCPDNGEFQGGGISDLDELSSEHRFMSQTIHRIASNALKIKAHEVKANE